MRIDDAPPGKARGRATAIVAVGGTGAGLTVVHLATRASCPSGYVRLVDFSLWVLGASILVATPALVSLRRQVRLPAFIEVVLLAVGALAILAAAAHLVVLRHSCWTF